MAFFLTVEVESLLTPDDFREQVVAPLRVALERDGVGRLLESDLDNESVGVYELAIEVENEGRARELVAEVLRTIK